MVTGTRLSFSSDSSGEGGDGAEGDDDGDAGGEFGDQDDGVQGNVGSGWMDGQGGDDHALVRRPSFKERLQEVHDTVAAIASQPLKLKPKQ